ncbi:MAG: helix-turn-helix transcriptional regulator [Bacteroidia bacterium]|nr:helix-turn-helix transcriptional regulator [Bacteroidia bacterium]
MSIFSKVLDSLNVVFHKAEMREVIRPVEFNGLIFPINHITQLHKGHMYNDGSTVSMKEGTFYFRPAGREINSLHGTSKEYARFGRDGFPSQEAREKHLKRISCFSDVSDKKEIFSFVGFDVMLYDAVPFFSILELPAFSIPYDLELAFLIRQLCIESEQEKIGRAVLLKNYTEEVVIQLCRYIDSQPQFAKNIEKINYLTDKRLIKLIQFIQENLGSDLSNKRLAEVAFLSEDYIGQFFKSLTNSNIQDYVESQRLERARLMLNTTSNNIQEISQAVGFKDPAYFSRRFKMKFKVNANTLRKSEEDII